MIGQGKMSRVFLILFFLVAPGVGATRAGAVPGTNVLVSESFDDGNLARRDWYDGTRFRIAGGSHALKPISNSIRST
jgi:hypothetical protein